VPNLLQNARGARLILIGANSTAYAAALVERNPELGDKIVATGQLDAAQMSVHIAACDVLIQPYPDGISSRRTTAMAGLFLGVPVITTSGHLTEPLWEESHAVRLAAVGDWHAFNASVCRLLSNADERRRLALDARRYYDEHFDVRHTISALRAAA
jgi:glycosyltransferase involved in cell wall biosynthesis